MKYFFINKLLIKAVVFSTLILHVSALICQNSNIGSYPAINTYTTCPQWDLIEQCPVTNTLYRGGTIKARCTDISLTELTFEVKKCLETNFSEGGTVHLRKDGVCQSNIQSFNYAAGQSSVTVGIPIPSNFGSNGSVSYYFIVESNSGDFFICDPINIYLTENGLTQALSIPNNEFDAGVLKLRIKSIRPSTNTEGMLRVTFEVGNLLNIDFGLYPGTYPSCEVDYQNRVATIPAGSINMANSWRPILVYSGYEDKIYTDEISVEIDPLSNPCISIMPPNPNDWSTYLSVFVAPIIDLIIELVFDEGTNEEADQYFIDNSTQLKSLIFGTISHFLVNEIGEPGVVFSDLATAANAEQMAQVISNLISHLLTDQELRSEIAGHFNSQLGSLLTEDDPYVILTELVLEGLESLVGDDPKRIRLRSKHVDYFTKATNFVAGIYDFTVFDFGYTIPIEKNYEDLFGCESDNYEPNETLQAAPLLGQWGQEGPNAALAYGTIDHPNDVDFYRVTTFGVGELDVSLGDLAKDYRLVIYQQNLIGGESNYNLLDYSNNPGTESEQTTISTCSYNFFNNTNGEATYYVKIYSVNGEHSCLNYTLNLAWNPGINNCTGSSNLGEGEGQVSRSFTSNCADCFDGILNGQEIGIDCGGPDCPSCFCNISIENISTTCLVDINRYNVHFDLTTNDYYQYNVYAYDSEGLVGSTIPLAPNGANVIFGIPNGTDIVVRVEQVDDPYGCFYEYPLIAPECDSSSPSCYSPSITALSPSIGTSFNIGDPVTLSWSSIVPPNSCFSHYQFQASFTSSFSSPAIDYSHPNTSVSFTATNPAVVYWRVRGVNSDGLTGSWSLVSFYEIVESDNSSNSQEPVVQASNLFFTSVGTDNIRANWTRGNGNECLLVCTPCGQTAANPIDGVEYFTSSNFPNAQTIGTSQSRVVYQGVSNTRNINGLDINTCYQFRVYELNNSDSSPQYNTANPPVAAQFTVDQLDLDFTWEPNPIVEDAEIDFDWISSLGGLSIEQWTFEGGDPNYDDGNGDNVIFSEPGTYNVTLEGYHAPSGQWQTVGKTITVNDDANFYGDIAFTSGTPSYLDLSPGADFTVEWVATNEGLENIVLTNTEYYFSDNAILDGSDIQFAVFNCQSSLGCDDDNHQELLSSEETFSYTRELEVPASTGIGTKYILVKAISTAAPSAGPEQNTNNNVIAIAINIVPSLPDLVIYDPVVSELTVQSGEDFDVTITFDNIGTASVYGCPKYNIYISDDELLSPDDQNYLRGHFLANASWCVTDSYINTTPHMDTRTIATSVFLPDGDYFLLFCIDSDLASLNEFAEIREDNNLVAVPIRVRNPQQPASQVENLHVSQINTSSVNITWTPGSGNYTSIIATSQSPSLYLPNDGDLYEGNTNWNQAPYWIGPSAPQGVSTTRIVYTGTGNQAQIENLPSDQTWYFTAHSYDVANSLPDYLQANASTVVTHLGEESSSWDHLFKDEDLLDYEIKQIQGFDTDANLVCMGGNDGIVLISEDGGESFLLSKLSQNQDITSTAITNDQTIYLGLYGGDIAMSTDLGQSWSTSNLSTNISIAWVFDILFLNEQTGFVLTRNADNNHAELFQTDDGGMTWGHLYSYPEKLYSITEVKGVLWMCGLNSSILRSNTNGQSWEIIQNNIPAAETINGIQFLSSDIGFLHTRSEIYKTIDGGNTWNAIRTFTGPGFLNDFGISFINENIGYIINTYGEDKGLVEMTVDGGSNWSEVFTFSDNSPLGIFCSDSQGYIFGSELGVFDLCQPTTYYLDNDGDGIGGSTTILSCFQEAGLVLITGDCDDTNPLIHPGASELCNGVDDNCNGLGDEPYLDACNQCKTIADSTFTPKIANLNTVICTGDSIILSLDLPIGAPQNFVWSSGEIAHSISVSPADTTFYSVSNISGYSNCNSSVGVFVEPCSTCYDSIQNGAETGIDCGGPNCSPCPANQLVLYNSVASASETIYFKIEVLPMTVATVLLDGEVFGSYNSTVDSLSFSSIKPAVHYLTMEIDGVEVDRRAIQFLSCGWQAYIYTDENPEAIPQCDAIKNGVAYIPPPVVDE
ncbi:MAG: MopE-related protein, partial [Bacteroidota bacterium]